MYIYKDKNMCTGCTACSNICPRNAVTMKPDNKGFLYPEVDLSLCVDCGLCRNVCHTYERKKKKYEESAFYYINEDSEILSQSSSGGAFSFIARYVLEQNGWVSGAVYNAELKVVHTVSNNKECISQMRGSKYVQSDLQTVYADIKKLLIDGELVLFTGLPCQVIGLKKYLNKDYDNLLCVDLICHSTPSPLVLEKFLEMKEREMGVIQTISFRDKLGGWEDYSICFDTKHGKRYENHRKNLYMCGFTGDLYSRDSCSRCPAKERTGYWSDITIGDLWGAKELIPDKDCSKGVSLVIAHSQQGLEVVYKAKMKPISIEAAVKKNPAYISSHTCNKDSKVFWEIFKKRGLMSAYKYIYNPPLFRKIKLKLLSSNSQKA